MRFSYVTLFEGLIASYFEDSILKRAIAKELLSVEFFNPRDYTLNKHGKVDDYQASGGAGLVLFPQPLFDLLRSIKHASPEAYIIFPTPSGKLFTQNDAKRLAKKKHLVFVSGRYEGIDERVIETFADELFCIGDYVLTGGELPSLVMSDAISRNIKGVLGNEDSLSMESFESPLLEAPCFSKPPIYENKSVPSEFLKGNHAKITSLKNKMSESKTKYFRPDLFSRFNAKH
ncbi:tRNA (guanosine(37)-N1)-methyltransferase TrmD [Sulfurospirillum multivorans]|uniref:tRNA (guanine-N(1)-)-methyltransferase n=2 Tax=Sulfurospirillum multivorans TaxID=66821 RepID=A0AA86E047_SULMK|nr:tRNA (guanosine(37)-N1)-methyltransferase TrmD [Sulfurospirillum multivorans]AHJ13540.1 tRNA (guanine(37)-N(1))-methyltransferase [Sulfurospirillum multivorans DSM 12446]QEH07030.1 tRNA (guanine(37)-N(1))-methyltransferase [Sulfurospirillum multivorans]